MVVDDVFQRLVEAYIWPLSAAACALALAVFTTLVIRRYWADKHLAQRALRKRELKQALLVHLANPLRNLRAAINRHEGDMALLAETLPPVLDTISGRSRDNLLRDLRAVGFYDWLCRRLYSTDVIKQNQLLRLAAHWPEPAVIQRLQSLLTCGYPLLRMSAAEALASTRRGEFLPLIVGEFCASNWRSPELMCDVLRRFGPRAVPEITRLLSATAQPPTPEPVQCAALLALTQMADAETLFRAALNHCQCTSDSKRRLAFAALAETAMPVPGNLLASAANDPCWRVRSAAVTCVLNSGGSHISLLLSMLGDSNWLVGLAAARALLSPRAGAAGAQLLRSVAKRDSTAGRRAMLALSEQGLQQETLNGVA